MKLSAIQTLEISGMVQAARTGDVLAVRTRGFWGVAIRCLLSRGLKRCWTNHNAPVYRCYRKTRTMQFEPPSAHEVALEEYLTELYQAGGKAILLRPDAYRAGLSVKAMDHLITEWRNMDGTPYDKRSIRMFCRMVFRKSAHVLTNDKERLYCTEGTLLPIIGNPFVIWRPDTIKNESYPAPIHVEHLIRQERLLFVAGNRQLYERICEA